ncbi:MAG: hypothetical protein AAF515_03130 [Pseudomonadota bacterium]
MDALISPGFEAVLDAWRVPVLCLLAAACLANAVGDCFLLRGVRHTDWDPGIEALRRNDDAHLKWGSLTGMFTIGCWFLLTPYAMGLGGVLGLAFTLSYLLYVAVTLAFHLSYGFVGLGVKASPDLEKPFRGLLGPIVLTSFLSALACSVAWAAHILMSGASLWYLLTTPVATVVFFQMLFGRALARVPYYLVVSGPIAMFAFFAGFLHYTAH